MILITQLTEMIKNASICVIYSQKLAVYTGVNRLLFGFNYSEATLLWVRFSPTLLGVLGMRLERQGDRSLLWKAMPRSPRMYDAREEQGYRPAAMTT